MMNTTLKGKPDAGNPHVAPTLRYGGTGRFNEGEVAPMKPRRGSLLYKHFMFAAGVFYCGAVLGGGHNLIPNAGFEDVDASGQPVGWPMPREGFHYESGSGLDDSRALVIERTTDKPYVVVSRDLPSFKPGRWYRIGATMKLTGRRVVHDKRIAGTEPGAHVAMAFYDANGKWMSEHSTQSANGSSSAWCEVESIFQTPTNAVSSKVYAFLDFGLAGRAVFDDVFITEIVRRPIVSLVSDTYRDCAAEGRVTFVAAVDSNEACDATRGEFLLPCSGGWMRRTVPCALTNGSARVTVDVSSIPFGVSMIQFRLIDGSGRRIDSRVLSFERVKQLPRRKAWIDTRHRLIVDGQPFFPLGMYTDRLEGDGLTRYKEGPFNCLQNYGELSRAEMDRFHAAGLRVICSVNGAYVGQQFKPAYGVRTREDELSWVAYYLREMKDHPALLAWYVMDEGLLSLIPRLEERYRLIKDLDPDHPTWGVMCNPEFASCYGNCFDVTGADPYPIMRNPPKSQPPRTIDRVSSWTHLCDAGAIGTKAIWMVPQAFDWDWYDGRWGSRVPTRDELGNMAWQSIAAGANGIIWYSYAVHVKNLKGAARDAFWNDIKGVSAEIRDCIPLFLSEESAPSVVARPAGVVARAFRQNGTIQVLVVNATYKPVCGEVALEDASRLTVNLPPLGVKWISTR